MKYFVEYSKEFDCWELYFGEKPNDMKVAEFWSHCWAKFVCRVMNENLPKRREK